ncbi:MAG: large conductance mechanosensitive channel protein MscL [Firmicutes bacterium]|nr:large conductance mechanosensitive channel protein MscL [Bacillota bacterium]
MEEVATEVTCPTEAIECPKEKKRAKRALARLRRAEQSFFADFKTFISKGNIVQLAVAFIMGAAFTAIVTSLVNDLFMPFIGLIFGQTDIGALTWEVSDNLTIHYGRFILAIVNFLLVALILFMIIKIFARAQRDMKVLRKHHPEKVEEAQAPTLTLTEELLTEIKELLKTKAEEGNGEG